MCPRAMVHAGKDTRVITIRRSWEVPTGRGQRTLLCVLSQMGNKVYGQQRELPRAGSL